MNSLISRCGSHATHVLVFAAALGALSLARAHDGHSFTTPPPGPEREALRAELLQDWLRASKSSAKPIASSPSASRPQKAVTLAVSGSAITLLPLLESAASSTAPLQATAFQRFPKLQLRWDAEALYIGSTGLPDHNMMVGITAWQQQVPLPQNYTGANAWRLPLHPKVATQPQSIRHHFLRGAIAIAVNGIPIFNPQNNRGEVSAEIGELDQWGGHCGRADDYHYHAAPLHLQAIVGRALPIAYALDGYPIYGLTEPDGSAPTHLDDYNGHETPGLGYHYHASAKYPYLNGGFHGEVVELEAQVDPQPRANPVREALPPLRGAKITDFRASADGLTHTLTYQVSGAPGVVKYTSMSGGVWAFQYLTPEGVQSDATYRERPARQGPGEPRPPRQREDGPQRREGPPDRPQSAPSRFGPEALKKPTASFSLTSTEVSDGGALPVEYTGDGPGSTLPLAWKGEPAGTKSFVLIMDHAAPGNEMKWYWTLWNIPLTVHNLVKNTQDVGQLGTSFKGQLGYEPPHSQGPGPKTYVITVYALSQPLETSLSSRAVNRETLMEAMQDKVLASASLHVVYTRGGNSPQNNRPPRPN